MIDREDGREDGEEEPLFFFFFFTFICLLGLPVIGFH